MSRPSEQTSIRGASILLVLEAAQKVREWQGGYMTGPGYNNITSKHDSPSVSHQQQYIMSSGQLMVTANNL